MPNPHTRVGNNRTKSSIRAADPGTGLGGVFGGNLVWNNVEVAIPKYGETPAVPSKGYLKHSHSEYSGGALDINTLELVEYDCFHGGADVSGDFNKHCQQFWLTEPAIRTSSHADGDIGAEGVEKIGKLDISFDGDNRKWVAGISQIDVRETTFIDTVDDHSAVLYPYSVTWNTYTNAWGFYAVFR